MSKDCLFFFFFFFCSTFYSLVYFFFYHSLSSHQYISLSFKSIGFCIQKTNSRLNMFLILLSFLHTFFEYILHSLYWYCVFLEVREVTYLSSKCTYVPTNGVLYLCIHYYITTFIILIHAYNGRIFTYIAVLFHGNLNVVSQLSIPLETKESFSCYVSI